MATRKRLLEAIRQARLRLGNPYAFLDGEGRLDGVLPEPPPCPTRQSSRTSKSPSARARELQVLVWKNRHRLWADSVPQDPVEILDPETAARLLGLEVDLVEDFDTKRRDKELAGDLDTQARRIRVSVWSSRISRRFTVAHELGHYLLHDSSVMHRNRATLKTREEFEADKFAVEYLMPAKLVRERFQQQFDVTGTFVLTTETAYGLSPSNHIQILRMARSPRDLARLLATVEEYRGVRIPSLAGQFGVSQETMASRLLELRLIED